jgi:tetratricopeptide (TPR) repeat protein
MAHFCLGKQALETRLTDQALLHFQTAGHLCEEEDPGHSLHAAILTGLCETQFRLEQYEPALVSGKHALCLSQESTPPDAQEYLLLLLSRINLALGNSASALEYVQDARRSASQTNDATRVANILLVLSEIQHKENQCLEARSSCQEVLQLDNVSLSKG